MAYRHEQTGRIYAALIPLAVVLAVLAAATIAVAGRNGGLAPGLALIVAAALLVAFARLQIEVGSGPHAVLRWAMTFGWPRGTMPIDEIVSADIVPVTFWMGVGIHLTLRGWVWNVALGRGVALRSTGGAEIVLGTDDPQGLLDAIQRARAAAAP